MPISNHSAIEAHAEQKKGATLVDVRSTREYNAGHAAGALNVPLMEHDEETGQMMPNPDFIRVMQANFPADAPLVLACQGGGRSLRAARMLETFGYNNLANVLGGFLGDTTSAPGGSYAELVARADASE